MMINDIIFIEWEQIVDTETIFIAWKSLKYYFKYLASSWLFYSKLQDSDHKISNNFCVKFKFNKQRCCLEYLIYYIQKYKLAKSKKINQTLKINKFPF